MSDSVLPGNNALLRKTKELIISQSIILLAIILLLVSPSTTMTSGQQQEPSTSAQESLPQQTAGISQEVSNNTITLPLLNDSRLEVEQVVDGLYW